MNIHTALKPPKRSYSLLSGGFFFCIFHRGLIFLKKYAILIKDEEIILSSYCRHIRIVAGDIVCARSYNQGISDIKLFWFCPNTQWEIILLLGIVLGLLNYFLKPLLKALSLPLEIITLGLFTIVINMALIWLLGLMFDELYVPLFLPLLYTTLIIWGLNHRVSIILIKKK